MTGAFAEKKYKCIKFSFGIVRERQFLLETPFHLPSKFNRYSSSSFDFSCVSVLKYAFISLEFLGSAGLAEYIHDMDFAALNHVTGSALPALMQIKRNVPGRNAGVWPAAEHSSASV